MFKNRKYHALRVDPEKCFGCVHCMQVCPTEAIRVKNGLAHVNDLRCVDCGNCMRVCPADAFYIIQDDLSRIHEYKYRIALLPSVTIGQFPESITDDQIYQATLKLGFTHVYEVEQPVRWLIDAIYEHRRVNPEKQPMISSFCPAIVRLIQIKYPSLTGNIMNLKAPHDLAAHFVKEKLKSEGASDEEIGLFYIAPCSAKIAAVKDPEGERGGIINGIINMNEFFNRVMTIIAGHPRQEFGGYREYLSREGILWPMPRGEARLFKRRSMAVDGIHNVVKILEKLETDELPDVDFLELRSCDQGCAGGILLPGNRFLTVERLARRARRYPRAEEAAADDRLREKVVMQLTTDPVEPSRVFQLDPDRSRALEKLAKVDRIICQLPAIDCGACGAPNCHALAEDMVMGMAKMTDCVHLQQRWQREGRVTSQRAFGNLEKIWGNGRFEADCKKRGARNEGF
jgi:iron only hydrogenase large subunit-like protein